MKNRLILVFIYIVSISLLGVCELFLCNDYYKKQITKKVEVPEENNVIVKVEIKHFNKLMIVAHPDDDTIFGGSHLLNDEYVVVCVTCGVNPVRLKEFKKAMNYTEDKYLYLNHTDLYKGFISDWSNEEDDVEDQLDNIINSRDWDLIVTHNPDGEYGHVQHKMINKIVTSKVSDKSKLYYFGIFHKKSEESDVDKLSDEIMSKKSEVLSIYKSQRLDDNSRYLYMFSHENWIKYDDWK